MLVLIVNFFIGACLGSHALVIYQRREQNNYLLAFSHCDFCNFPLTLWDQVPLFSFLLKRGKCTFCKNKIPVETFLVELIAGMLFIYNDFFSLSGIYLSIFIFFILLVSIFDYYQQEYEVIWLLPPLYLLVSSPFALFHYYHLYHWLIFSVMLLIFIIMNLTQKLGWGDTLIFVLLALYLGIFSTLKIFLAASLFSILGYLLTFKIEPKPFLPYLVLGMIAHNFI